MNRVYILLIFIINVLSSCTDNSIKVGLLLPNFKDSRYTKDKQFFSDKLKQLGGSVEVGDANNDPNVQFDQAEDMIKDGVKVLVVCAVNQNLAASIVRLAHDKGIKVIAYERVIRNCDLDYLISFNHFIVGKQQAFYAIQRKPSGNYVLIGGDKSDRNAELIKNGQLKVLDSLSASTKINVVYNTYIEDWSEDNAYKEMCKVLNLSDKKIDVVLTANDGMAGGVIRALNDLQPGYPVIVTGLDADPLACRRIMDGKQSMTVYKSFKNQAEIAAELAMHIAKGESSKNCDEKTFNGSAYVPTISLQPTPVDRSNIAKIITDQGAF